MPSRRIALRSWPASRAKAAAFMASTGNTQGIRFRIRPPSSANSSASTSDSCSPLARRGQRRGSARRRDRAWPTTSKAWRCSPSPSSRSAPACRRVDGGHRGLGVAASSAGCGCRRRRRWPFAWPCWRPGPIRPGRNRRRGSCRASGPWRRRPASDRPTWRRRSAPATGCRVGTLLARLVEQRAGVGVAGLRRSPSPAGSSSNLPSSGMQTSSHTSQLASACER